MKIRMLFTISILVFAVLIVVGSCATFMFKTSVNRGDYTNVKKNIDKGANVNAINLWGNTALMEASSNGHTEIVKLLIEQGADVNAQPKLNGITALMLASSNGHTEIAKLLIKAGADVNAQSKHGTALIKAWQEGYTEIAKLLIEEGADVNAQDSSGCTALMWASREGYADIVKLLIEEGADVNVMTIIEVRSTSYQSFSGGMIYRDCEPTGGYTALICASEYGHTEIVKLLIEAGADVNARQWDDATALTYASREGHTEIVNLLIKAGAKE